MSFSAGKSEHEYVVVKSKKAGRMFGHQVRRRVKAHTCLLSVFTEPGRRFVHLHPDARNKHFSTSIAVELTTFREALQKTIRDCEQGSYSRRREAKWSGNVITFDAASKRAAQTLACCHRESIIYVGVVSGEPSGADAGWQVSDVFGSFVDEAREVLEILKKVPEYEAALEDERVVPGPRVDSLARVIF